MSNNYASMRRQLGTEVAARCAERLLAMRERLRPIRDERDEGSLLLATWNIRDFDSNRFGFGPRLGETFYYVAEIIACFDLVAVQEVSRDLDALRRVMGILGPEWDYLVTDVTEGRSGNGERMAFLYNRDKVSFRKVAGEVVLPDGQLVVAAKKVAPPADAPAEPAEAEPETTKQQFARSPFLVAFQSGWFKFNLCTVHIYYGADTGSKLARRVEEIRRLVAFFARRQDKDRDELGQPENYILLGDFNVVSPEHETMQALTAEGFEVPPQIDGDQVPGARRHFYDQIAVRVKDDRFRVARGGIVDVFADVFRDTEADRDLYAPHVPDTDPETDTDHEFRADTAKERYLKWRTWQMSDHDPLWIKIETDYADHYLRRVAGPDGSDD